MGPEMFNGVAETIVLFIILIAVVAFLFGVGVVFGFGWLSSHVAISWK